MPGFRDPPEKVPLPLQDLVQKSTSKKERGKNWEGSSIFYFFRAGTFLGIFSLPLEEMKSKFLSSIFQTQ
jgi:hypothetical protein